MFRIVRVFDTRLATDAGRVRQVQEILRSRVPPVPEATIAAIPDRLDDPVRFRRRHVLFVAEDTEHEVVGCALLAHHPEAAFGFLEHLSTATPRTGSGVAEALYEHVRDEAVALNCGALLFECLSDEIEDCPDPDLRERNAGRLRFAEGYGARPVAARSLRLPPADEHDCPAFLVVDGLGSDPELPIERTREIVRAILERRPGGPWSNADLDELISGIDGPTLRLREPRYGGRIPIAPSAETPSHRRVLLVVNDRHDILHVREKGFMESPTRVSSIFETLDTTDVCRHVEPRSYSDDKITAVHDPAFVEYLRSACAEIGDGPPLYPHVFPVPGEVRAPDHGPIRAGYYCLDTTTPLTGAVFPAARRAVDCALTAADAVRDGDRLAYALVRPPGHHAERSRFGGFCYFSNAAIAAEHLSADGRVAILDVDYHHGNGQQAIFYERDDVLTVSIHSHPEHDYPFFTGYPEETGRGAGEGFNLNVPLQPGVDGSVYLRHLTPVLERIGDFDPLYLVVCLGLDTAKGDPTGRWELLPEDLEANGRAIGELHLPTLVVQEGGYRVQTLGTNALHFLRGLAASALV